MSEWVFNSQWFCNRKYLFSGLCTSSKCFQISPISIHKQPHCISINHIRKVFYRKWKTLSSWWQKAFSKHLLKSSNFSNKQHSSFLTKFWETFCQAPKSSEPACLPAILPRKVSAPWKWLRKALPEIIKSSPGSQFNKANNLLLHQEHS